MKVHISQSDGFICVESVEVNGEVVAAYDPKTERTDFSALKSRTDLESRSVELYLNGELQGEREFVRVTAVEDVTTGKPLDTLFLAVP